MQQDRERHHERDHVLVVDERIRCHDLVSYTFTVDMTDNNAGEIQFSTRLLAGAHAFTGASLQIKGAGNAQLHQAGRSARCAEPGPHKTALTAVAPGQTMTYTLSYQNTASGSGTTNRATGVQITDVLPAAVTYVVGSCTAMHL